MQVVVVKTDCVRTPMATSTVNVSQTSLEQDASLKGDVPLNNVLELVRIEPGFNHK